MIYGRAVPPLNVWPGQFLRPSAVSIGATGAALRGVLRGDLAAVHPGEAELPHLTHSGKLVAFRILGTYVALPTTSAFGADLGQPTQASEVAVLAGVTFLTRASRL